MSMMAVAAAMLGIGAMPTTFQLRSPPPLPKYRSARGKGSGGGNRDKIAKLIKQKGLKPRAAVEPVEPEPTLRQVIREEHRQLSGQGIPRSKDGNRLGLLARRRMHLDAMASF
jgi:hypothetical protein